MVNLTENSKLTASNAATYDRFGRNVDVLGDTVIVGADQRDSGGGAAYVFYRNDAGTPLNPSDDFWSESAILEASDGATGDQFGNVVALDGNRAIISAHCDDHSGQVDAGSAYIFERSENGTPLDLNDDVWVEVAKLKASDASGDDQFGRGADIEGDTAVVGATNGEINVADSGSVYFFERQSDGTWIEQGEIDRNDAQSSGSFGGEKIDLEGGTLVVGDTSYNAGAGGAFVLVRNNLSPIVDAGPDQLISDADGSESEAVTIIGSATDSDGTVVSYEWREGTNVLGNCPTLNTTLAIGVHTLTLSATDDQGAVGIGTIVFTVQSVPTNEVLYVHSISFESRKGGKEWRAVVEVRDEFGLVFAGATVTVEFAGQQEPFSGETDANGQFRTRWLRLSSGSYQAEVVDLALMDQSSTWDKTQGWLDDDDNDGLPDSGFSF